MIEEMQQPRACSFCGHVYSWISIDEQKVIVFRVCPECKDHALSPPVTSTREEMLISATVMVLIVAGLFVLSFFR